MKNHLRKLTLLASALLLSSLVLLPVSHANRRSNLNHIQTPSVFSFSNTTPITIPADELGSVADPYPSIINVSGVSGSVVNVAVKLVNISHTFPDDIDVLLVSPSGRNLIVMSDAGGSTDLVNNTITIDDSAEAPFASFGGIPTGTFQPANYEEGDIFPGVSEPYFSPVPFGGSTLASAFAGDQPNGAWMLLIVDDSIGDVGVVDGGWELTLTTQDNGGGTPCTISCPSNIVVSTDPGSCMATVSYPNATVAGNCGPVTYSHPSGSQFPVGTTVVTATATQSDMTTQTCSFSVTVTNDQPTTLTTSVAVRTMGPPFDHRLVNVGLRGSVTGGCSSAGPVQVAVYSDEDDGWFGPDAKDIAFGTLRLRRERRWWGDGRVYLIISSVTDGAGNRSQSCNTVTVPYSKGKRHIAWVEAQAAAAKAQCQASGGPPSRYFAVGENRH